MRIGEEGNVMLRYLGVNKYKVELGYPNLHGFEHTQNQPGILTHLSLFIH